VRAGSDAPTPASEMNPTLPATLFDFADRRAADAWRTLVLPLADFSPRFRGRVIPAAPPLDAVRIRQVGLMIAGRQAGPFALGIRRIELA